MSLTPSTMVALGTTAPDFSLPDVVSGHIITRDAAAHNGLLVIFMCVHCPYVKHIEPELSRLSRDYAGKIGIVAISSNDVEEFPQDAPAEMKKQAAHLQLNFPYLYDESQSVARAYEAACTPDIFLFDKNLKLAYRGQLDDSRPKRPSGGGNDIPLTGKDLRSALDAVLAGIAPSSVQKTSIGCNIKWKS